MRSIYTYGKKGLLLILAIVLFSNTTFALSVDFHFCQDELKSVTFFGERATCSKMSDNREANSSCCEKKPSTNQTSFCSESCCNHEQIDNKGDLNKSKSSVNQVDFEDVIYTYFETTTSFVIVIPVKLGDSYIPAPPPLVAKDIQAYLQVFVI